MGVKKLLKTDFGISITGIAGPSGGTKAKPVGLTFIAVTSREKTICKKYDLGNLNILELASFGNIRKDGGRTISKIRLIFV